MPAPSRAHARGENEGKKLNRPISSITLAETIIRSQLFPFMLALLPLAMVAGVYGAIAGHLSFLTELGLSIGMVFTALGFVLGIRMWLTRAPQFSHSAVEALKHQLEENILLRQAARQRNGNYHFNGVNRNKTSNASLLHIINKGNFIDKTTSYRKLVEDGPEYQLGICPVMFPRCTGRTTWVSFMNLVCGPLWGSPEPERKEFYNAVSGLEEGKWFLHRPLRPVLQFTMSGMTTPKGFQGKIHQQFQSYGIKGSPFFFLMAMFLKL